MQLIQLASRDLSDLPAFVSAGSQWSSWRKENMDTPYMRNWVHHTTLAMISISQEAPGPVSFHANFLGILSETLQASPFFVWNSFTSGRAIKARNSEALLQAVAQGAVVCCDRWQGWICWLGFKMLFGTQSAVSRRRAASDRRVCFGGRKKSTCRLDLILKDIFWSVSTLWSHVPFPVLQTQSKSWGIRGLGLCTVCTLTIQVLTWCALIWLRQIDVIVCFLDFVFRCCKRPSPISAITIVFNKFQFLGKSNYCCWHSYIVS